MNPELNIDFYKADHKSQYPKRTTMIVTLPQAALD